MALRSHPLAAQRVGDIVRFDMATAQVLADNGIGPRYMAWTLESAVRASGADLEAVIRSLVKRFARTRKQDLQLTES